MGARGRQPSEWRAAGERFTCSTCGAAPGRPCTKPSWITSPPHAPRRRKLEAAQLAAIRR